MRTAMMPPNGSTQIRQPTTAPDPQPENLMDYRCPHCQMSLRGKRIALVSVPGQRMHKRALTCPYCAGAIASNRHMAEYSYQLLGALPAAPLSKFFIEDKGGMAMLAIGVVLLICSISISLHIHFSVLKNWPRYLPFKSGA